MYINTTTLTVLSEQEIRNLNPNTSFGNPFLPPEEYAFLFEAPKPEHATVTQRVQAAQPVLTDKGHWEEQWEVVELYETQEERDLAVTTDLETRRLALVPKLVSMRQARLALLSAGLLEDVEGAITTAGPAAKIEWEYAQEVRRDYGLVPAMATVLGMTEIQLDDLFTLAATF